MRCTTPRAKFLQMHHYVSKEEPIKWHCATPSRNMSRDCVDHSIGVEFKGLCLTLFCVVMRSPISLCNFTIVVPDRSYKCQGKEVETTAKNRNNGAKELKRSKGANRCNAAKRSEDNPKPPESLRSEAACLFKTSRGHSHIVHRRDRVTSLLIWLERVDHMFCSRFTDLKIRGNIAFCIFFLLPGSVCFYTLPCA